MSADLLQHELLFLLDSSDCFRTLSTEVQTNEECKVRNKSTCESLWMAVMEKRSHHLSRLLPQYAVQLSVSKENHSVYQSFWFVFQRFLLCSHLFVIF